MIAKEKKRESERGEGREGGRESRHAGARLVSHNGDQKYETGIKFMAVARGDVRPRLRCK